MKVRRKSRWRSKNVARRFKQRAQMRAAKERKRLARVAREEPMPDVSHVRIPRGKLSGFRVMITCLEDGERVQFTAVRMPAGNLSISPTLAGRSVAAVLRNYQPAPSR